MSPLASKTEVSLPFDVEWFSAVSHRSFLLGYPERNFSNREFTIATRRANICHAAEVHNNHHFTIP